MDRLTILVLDANVLIDWLGADRTVLALLPQCFARVVVPTVVLREVHDLDASAARDLGLEILLPTDAQLAEVVATLGGRLSTADRLCLIMARDCGAVCVTSDRALQRACGRASVPWLWGLTLLVHLVAAGALPGADARRIANAIVALNPLIPPSALLRLSAWITDAEAGTIPPESTPRRDDGP